MSFKNLFIDFETYSSVDLKACGAAAYTRSEDFKVLCCSVNGKIVSNESLKKSLSEPSNIIAHNIEFEMHVLKKLGINIDKHKFMCTAFLSQIFGGPRALRDAALFWGLEETKCDKGSIYIKYFTKQLDAGKPIEKKMYEGLKDYCNQDVKTTIALYNKLIIHFDHDIFRREFKYFKDTIKINNTGIPVDMKYANKLLKIYEEFEPRIQEYFKKKYGFNPRSSQQTLKWLNNPKIKTTQKKNIRSIWKTLTDEQRQMFLDKWLISSPQLKRLKYLKTATDDEDRLVGFLRFFGANTGRYTAKGINVLNFPRGDSFEELPDNFIDTYGTNSGTKLSQTIRGIVSPKNGRLICSDLSQIETRILLHLLEYKKWLDKLDAGEDIYLDFAKIIFGKDVEKGSLERQIAKAAVLSMGYGVGFNSFSLIVAKDIENPDMLMIKKAFNTYHKTFPKVRKYAKTWDIRLKSGLKYFELPNGAKRYLSKMDRDNLYGALLVGRYIQSIAREIIFEKQHQLLNEGFKVILNVYDEVVIETGENNKEDMTRIHEIMKSPVSWLPNFKIDAETKLVKRYGGKVYETI